MSSRFDDQIADPKMYAVPGAYDEIFNTLRRDDPVHWTEPQGYRPFWTVSKYRDIMEIERQNDRFLNENRLTLLPIEAEERIRKGPGRGTTNILRTIINMDGADHRAYRLLAQAWFMPPNLRKLETSIANLASEFVSKMERLGGRCDFVSDVAVWYPLRVIMMIFGIPPEEDKTVLRLTQAIFGSTDSEMTGGQTGDDVRQAAVKEMMAYLGAIAAERRKNPTDDLASLIANASINEEPIGAFEVISYYLIVATAGHDTTSSTTSGGLHALMSHPDQFAKLRANPDLLAPAVEEMLRWVTPIKHFFRTATEDYELRGRTIRAGDSLMMCYPSANRDDEIFDDPFSFKIDRSPNRHIAFGYGPHLCLGMHLARLEIKALYKEMLARIDTFEMVGDPAWVAANFVSGLKRLPISYHVQAAAKAG